MQMCRSGDAITVIVYLPEVASSYTRQSNTKFELKLPFLELQTISGLTDERMSFQCGLHYGRPKQKHI